MSGDGPGVVSFTIKFWHPGAEPTAPPNASDAGVITKTNVLFCAAATTSVTGIDIGAFVTPAAETITCPL